MSGPIPTGNGCSLEDCYTNIFALTDINGIKWRKLCIEPSQTRLDPFEDPVLSSYAKCLQADILSVWRRVAKHSESRPDVLFGRELWIFWYGDKPSILEEILAPELKEQEHGSWEKDSVMSYECRTLLFKALHNLIERCLLARNFIRLGRWFVQPQDPLLEQSASLSFSFNFFLHGESTVCASIEVKQHPPVLLLASQHLQCAAESGAQLNVILAPYGLNGTLTGVTYRDTDQTTKKALEEWRQFYPVKGEEGKDADTNKLPNLIEVVVAGVRMKYPSCYVLLVDERPGVPGDPQRPGSLAQLGILGAMGVGEDGLSLKGMEPTSDLTARTNRILSARLVEKIGQDGCITSGLSKRHNEGSLEEGQSGIWDFADPTTKTTCNCSRLRGVKNKAGSSLAGKQLDKKKTDKTLERQQSRLLRAVPFHRRQQAIEEYSQIDMDMSMPRVTAGMPQGGLNGVAGAMGGGSDIPHVSTSGNSDMVCNVSMESPASNAPSPLEESHNHGQMENTVTIDPTMPTLSPQPPAMKHGDKDPASVGGLKPIQNVNLSSASNSTNSNVLLNSVMTNGDTHAFHKPHFTSGFKPDATSSSVGGLHWNHQSLENTKANINSWLRSQQKQSDHKTFKRPCLPSSDGDPDSFSADSLYNFDSVSNWSDFPLKKMCFERIEMLNGIQDPMVNTNNNNFNPNQRPLQSLSPTPAADPYAFSDESSATPAGTPMSRSMRNSRDDIFQRPSPYREDEKGPEIFGFKEERNSMEFGSLTSPPTTPGALMSSSLTREEDLKPQESDLDNLFQPDSEDNDDAFIPNSPVKYLEDIRSTKTANTGPVDTIGVMDLFRMYPTPPSQETITDCSPKTSHEAVIESHPTVMESFPISLVKHELLPSTSLADELNKDGVYRPEVRAQYPSSAKYAPVELYSTQLSPPPHVPEYKPSWYHHQMPLTDKHVNHYMNIPSIENLPSIPSARMPSSAIEASPATFQNSVGQQRTPMSYELQSPASNASSYLNKTPNSNLNHHGTNNPVPEAHSLLVNIVLSDSILNLFKDQNFDSCNICVCNMTIKGSDVGVYIPNPTGETEYKCTCGFSAVMNKRFGHNAGLFYEDELEITGIRDDRFDKRKRSLLTLPQIKPEENVGKVPSNVEEVSQSVLQLLIGQFSGPYPSSSYVCLRDRLQVQAKSFPAQPFNIMSLQDCNEVTYFALDQGRQAMDHCPTKLEDNIMKSTCMHKWTFLQGVAQIPQSPLDSVDLLKGLQPILQDAIQNKRVTRLWEHTYKLQGPLTWIEFHQLAGRGSDENSEPQPIPSLLVGCEKDSANVSPYALRYWDKNMLEPYGHRRDIAYLVVTLDNDYILSLAQPFFKELSTMYEWLRLGRHAPISEKIRDGILRIGRSMQQKIGDQDVDDWFKYIPSNTVSSNLKLYAQTCKHYLGPFLAKQTDYKMLFAASTSSQRLPQNRTADLQNSESLNTSQSNDDRDGEGAHRDLHEEVADVSQGDGPVIVIYIVNPFTYGHDWDDRLSMIGLLRCYQEIVQGLPEFMQNNVYLQILPVQSIIDAKEGNNQFQLLKNIAFSVFTSCRLNLSHNVMGRSLTGFGPAAAAEQFLKRKANIESTGLYKLYNPPFILAPLKDKQEQLAESCSEKRENSTILLCVYCLSEDQRWLLASCTDDRGETIETCTVNIDIPNRNRRKKTSARRIGLGKLWDFILGVISMSSKPCRIVVGRFGRIGHGELKGWSGLLSKKNIQKCNKRMRDMCSQCTHQVEGEHPTIVSACLISFEQHRSFNLMPECVKAESEKQRRNCPLQTPRDASCSHILVFPTSATAQASTQQNQLDATGGIDLGGHNLEFGVDLADNIINDFDNNSDDFANLMDVFVSMTNSPHDNPGSPGQLDMGRNSPSKMNGVNVMSATPQEKDPQDDAPNLLQQPLAMGYYISTAETGPLPRWFWSACPDNEHTSVKCFKSALHVHFSTNQDDFMHSTAPGNTHPLDSNLTCDVL
ncbi:hypothetical protein DPMN_012599, partial [Dreissena polymorpha]